MDSSQYIIFAGGGSGGHVFPGLAVWESLQERDICNCIWIGSHKGPEKSLVTKYGIPFYAIATGKLRRYMSLKNVSDIYRIMMGIVQARRLLKKHKARYVISTGGFASFPVVFAAWTLGIPVASVILDISLSLANKLNKAFSSVLFFSYAATMDKVKSKVPKIYSAYPVRSQIYAANPVLIEQLYDINVYDKRVHNKTSSVYQKHKRIVFCVGGSLGAKQINDVVVHLRKALSDDVLIFHQTGKQLEQQDSHIQKDNTQQENISSHNYIQKDFFSKEYAHILAAADLVLSRAGTGAIWECIVLSRPTVLLPLPRSHSRGDQVENAAYFAKKGAMIDLGTDMSSQDIVKSIQLLLYDEKRQKELSMECHALLPSHKSVDIIADYIVSCV